MQRVDERTKLENALMKKALGYMCEEVTEEYVGETKDDMKLCKKKVNKKSVPPDLASLQILLSRLDEQNEYKSFSDAELYSEREKLQKLLEKGGEDDDRRDDNNTQM